jgi:hypothetical protein
LSRKPQVARAIALRVHVLASINLYDQAPLEAHKIDDISSKRLLPLELVPSEPSTA